MQREYSRCKSRCDFDGDLPVHFAAAAGKYNILLKYLKSGGDKNVANRLGWTPLMLAARNGHTSCVRTLLNFGADEGHRNSYGLCSLSFACASGNLEVVRLILKRIFQKGVAITGFEKFVSPAIFAVLFNHVHIIRYLFRYSFDFHRNCSVTDSSPVSLAFIAKKQKIMELFQNQGLTPSKVIINVTDPEHETPKFDSSYINDASGYLCLTPRPNKRRTFSNLDLTPSCMSPNLSPIYVSKKSATGGKLRTFRNPFPTGVSSNSLLNTKFSLTPTTLRFSSSSSGGNLYSSLNDNTNFLHGNYDRPVQKIRSASARVVPNLEIKPTEVADDVFGENGNAQNVNLNFLNLLRKKSLASCQTLINMYDINLDVLDSLTNESGNIDWDKRDLVLEALYEYNRSNVF